MRAPRRAILSIYLVTLGFLTKEGERCAGLMRMTAMLRSDAGVMWGGGGVFGFGAFAGLF